MGQEGTDRLVAGAEPLGHGEDVRRDAIFRTGIEMAGAAHAAHHLVEHQQHAVAVADRAEAREIARHRFCAAQRRPGDRFGKERRHVFRPLFQDRCLKFVGNADAVAFGVSSARRSRYS